MTGKKDKFTWEHAVVDSDLPQITKHILLTLAVRMDKTGGSCFPTVEQLMKMTGIGSKNTVIKYRDVAIEQGWLAMSNMGFRGQKWKRAQYVAAWPGTTTCGVAYDEGGSPDEPPSDTKVVHDVNHLSDEGGSPGEPKVVHLVNQDKEQTNKQTTERERAREAEGGEPSRPPHSDASDQPPDVDRRSDADAAGETAPPDPATVPGRAAFEKRVLRFCNGKGFAAGPWEDWDTGTPSYVGRQMAALSETERQQAERWRDPYLTDIRRRGKRPVSPGNFLRDRLWEGLDPELIRRFEAGQTAKTGETPPDRAAPFGPVWAAMRLAALAAGRVPADDGFRPTRFQEGLIAAGDATIEGLRVERHVRWLDGQAEQRRSVPAPGWAQALKPAMEPVPVAGPLADDWRALFAERSWPWFPRADGMDVVFLPKLSPAAPPSAGGLPAEGPDGRSASPASPADLEAALAAFAQALETATRTDGATGDDREA